MDVGPIIGAALTGGALATILQFFRDKKINASKTRIQIATENDQVELTSIGRLQAQQVYMQNFIDEQQDQIQGLLEEKKASEQREATQRLKIFDLETQVHSLMLQAQDMQHKCNLLTTQLEHIKNGS
jgi:Mg2+ and Co2+ transporter CorA